MVFASPIPCTARGLTRTTPGRALTQHSGSQHIHTHVRDFAGNTRFLYMRAEDTKYRHTCQRHAAASYGHLDVLEYLISKGQHQYQHYVLPEPGGLPILTYSVVFCVCEIVDYDDA